MRWLIGLGILAAGVGATIAARRMRRPLGQRSDVDPYAGTPDPYAPEPDEPDYENGCLILGKYHPALSPGRYRVCLTANQERELFKGKRKRQQKLGCGVFACAYSTPAKSRVVKFTRDSEDVAALLKAQKTGLVPKIFAVYKLKQGGRTIPATDPWTFRKTEATDVPVYALVMERLRTIPSEDRDRLDESLPNIRDVSEGRTTGNAYCDARVDDEGVTGCDDIEARVVTAAEKLRNAGIVWSDIHTGNIGFDKHGKLKVLDLGLTRTELKRRLKILAGLGRGARVSRFRLV